jgi:hypothetical protein
MGVYSQRFEDSRKGESRPELLSAGSRFAELTVFRFRVFDFRSANIYIDGEHL